MRETIYSPNSKYVYHDGVHTLKNGRKYKITRTGNPYAISPDGECSGGIIIHLWEHDQWVYLDHCPDEEILEKFFAALSRLPRLHSFYQRQVDAWMAACFGPGISFDKIERNYRFAEEAIELVQSAGMSKEEVLSLVDYVFNRPVGQVKQEVGGVLVTLAAFCNAHDIDIPECADEGLADAWRRTDTIRERQKSKPRFCGEQ